MIVSNPPNPSYAQVANEYFTLQSDAAPGGTGRLDRTGSPSVCGTTKPFPGMVAGNYHSNTRSLVNNGPAQCVTITVMSTDCTDGGPDVFPALYGSSFDPNQISAGYLGDAGTSTGGPGSTPATFSVDLAAGQTVTLAVGAVVSVGAGVTCHYTLNSPQLTDPLLPPAPTLNDWALAAFGTFLAATGVLIMRRRRRA